jgi:cytochrome P450
MPMLKYGPMWKKHRRLANTALSIAAVKKYHNLQQEITAMYLNSLIDAPKQFAPQLRLYVPIHPPPLLASSLASVPVPLEESS